MRPEEEQEAVDMLTSMMGGGFGGDEARRVLRKHGGDVQKAADAILSGDLGKEEVSTWQNTVHSSQDVGYTDIPSSSSISQVNQASSSAVIDLTEGNDSTRSWQLGQAQNEIKFGPSERAPDPSWQMVTTNTSVDTNQDDRSLKDAIQASLADFNSDELEVFPLERTLREGGRPVALRPEAPTLAYAALIVQAFFQIPQIREKVSMLILPETNPDAPSGRYERIDRAVWNLVELFTNLDLAQLSSLVDKDVLPALQVRPWDGAAESLGELSAEFIKSIGGVIEGVLNEQRPEDEPPVRLFTFGHGQAESRGGSYKVLNKASVEGSVVTVEVGDSVAPNDLYSRLSYHLSRYTGSISHHDVIFEPSEVVLFQLKPFPSPATAAVKPSAEPFVFPKHFYLDRFMLKNLPITDQKRTLERDMLAQIEKLTRKKEFMTRFNNRDTLKDLGASLHYYEHVAEGKGDPEREAAIRNTAVKLRHIMNQVISDTREAEREIERLQAEVAAVFDCPELQEYQYDLRAVFMHTGLPGRKQIFSYVQDGHGIWWKTLDYTVTEVPEETVLTDPTGLHLGAGPYLLIYSRHLSEDQMNAPIRWPAGFVEAVMEHNERFLAMVQPEPGEHESRPGDAADPAPSMPSSFPFSPAVFPEQRETHPMDIAEDVQT
ncbi:putative ubiquitin carboxyl-terminal hydrolase [Lyophyllum shimeji]|uniref:Ubiquitin carboxyl-terminal hydrolase n=1 Tax=Lyophyllum shimeji TaxID=47721 RepID=A0A9P3PQK4_LYOSH|nr:putative ubiquitin carboxyl-terminal hydrolase [Lyophyllum shimeji]